jgi:predicted dehydrogenase
MLDNLKESMKRPESTVWLVGTGPMAVEYYKVLASLGVLVVAIGRGDSSASAFEAKTGAKAIRGGLEAFIASRPSLPGAAIVAVGVDDLCSAASGLARCGVKRILVEKPGALRRSELERLAEEAALADREILIGYNRRYYASVLKARELIEEDGGLRSITFEFTEWSHQIEKLSTNEKIKARWLLANSSHVIDLAFYLAGRPREWKCYHKGGLNWHPTASAFAGAGITENDVLFSYHANWNGPGRWGVEAVTEKSRYILRPLEKLQVMRKGSVAIEAAEIDDDLDLRYKAGLYRQVADFLERKEGALCSINDQVLNFKIYEEIAGYS